MQLPVIPFHIPRAIATASASLMLLGGHLPVAAQTMQLSGWCDAVNPTCVRVHDAGALIEGQGGSRQAVFTVSLVRPMAETIIVNVDTTEGTAKGTDRAPSDPDYADSGATLLFRPGETVKSHAVSIYGDTRLEADEVFYLDIEDVTGSGVYVMDGRGQATIANDDYPSVRIGDGSVIEGDGGSRQMTFTVSLSAAHAQPVSLKFSTASDSASAGVDYATRTNVSLSFAPGTVSKTISVNVNGDLANESNESFFVNLTNVSNATIGDAQGRGTILDDDDPPGVPLPPCPGCPIP